VLPEFDWNFDFELIVSDLLLVVLEEGLSYLRYRFGRK
jgi:hypothetical protein